MQRSRYSTDILPKDVPLKNSVLFAYGANIGTVNESGDIENGLRTLSNKIYGAGERKKPNFLIMCLITSESSTNVKPKHINYNVKCGFH